MIEAENGNDALVWAQKNSTPIHLVITDVIMPGMEGRQVIESLRAQRPNIRVLYTHGHLDETVIRHGLIASTEFFLSKPFTMIGLLKKVRIVLDKQE